MRFLLDSNVLFWMISDRSRLTTRVLQILEDDTHDSFVSLASLWELSIKIKKGKLSIPGDSIRSVSEQLETLGIQVLPITTTHVERVEALPPLHGDPFDRMIVAQALEESMTILSADREMADYAVPVIWK